MGPLVPDLVNDQLNLVIALLLGIAFGFVLEQAGFSSSRKLTGLFYGTDFTVLRVFFTAGVTAMSGVLILKQFGWLDADLIYINPTFLHSAILGGLIMGVGFVIGGYCPGTSFCGAAVGRLDALAFVIGGFLGIFLFGEAFPLFQDFYKAGAKGDLLVSTVLGLSEGQFAGLMIAVAVAAFVLTTKLEKKINPESGAFAFSANRHRAAGAVLLCVAVTLAMVPDRKARLMAAVPGNPVRMMAPDELAIHLLDRDPKLQLIDVREALAYSKTTLPGAVNVPASALFGKEGRTALAGKHVVKVFFDRDEAGSARAAAVARLCGFENVAALEGGLDRFMANVVRVSPSQARELDAGTLSFRMRAGAEIAALIKRQSGPKPVKVIRRVQGGCGG